MEGKERIIEREKRLYEVALSGSVDSFNQLMKEDELTLARICTNCFDDTPLHVAAMLGHLDFAKALLNHKPDLAAEFNSQGSSPLHLASTNGYLELVKLLISANSDVCLVCDEDGRTPLHLAVMKGRVDVIKELVKAKIEVVPHRIDGGETLLHIAVKHNRLGSLKMLMELAGEEIKDCDLVNVKDDSRNTVLHTATSLKQTETVKYLISETGVKVNEVNANGFTALDVIENLPRDIKFMEIRECLINNGTLRAAKILETAHNNHPVAKISEKPLDASTNNESMQPSKGKKQDAKISEKRLDASTNKESMQPSMGKKQVDWAEKIRGALMVVSSLVKKILGAFMVVASWLQKKHGALMVVASVITISFLVSRLPLRRRTFMYLLVVMVTIIAVAFSYLGSKSAISDTVETNTFFDTTINAMLG